MSKEYFESVILLTNNNDNCLGLKTAEQQERDNKTGVASRLNPWISEPISEYIRIRREAYLTNYIDYQKLASGCNAALQLKAALCALSAGEIVPYDSLGADVAKKLVTEDYRLFKSFAKTIKDAQLYGMVGAGNGHNVHLAELIKFFTFLYEGKPQNNPLLYGLADESDFAMLGNVEKIASEDQKAAYVYLSQHRRAVLSYMKVISSEIERLIKMTPQDLAMTFTEDDVHQVAVVRKLKLAFNRLSDQVAYGKRFRGILSTDATGQPCIVYHLEDCRYNDILEHEALQQKISMRLTKKNLTKVAQFFAVLIAIGQVAFATTVATGLLAWVIGLAAAITNFILFSREIKGVLLSLMKGELSNDLSSLSLVFLLVWFLASLATAVVAGGLTMLSLVSFFGYVVSTAPYLCLAFACTISLVTTLGVFALFFQVGAGFVQGLRGQSLTRLFKSSWISLRKFLAPPALNTEVKDLKVQVDAYEQQLHALKRVGGQMHRAEILALQAEYLAIRGHLRRALFAHYSRHALKMIFMLVLVLFSLFAVILSTYAFSVLSVKGTADTLKTVLRWNSEVSATLAYCLTWYIAAPLNGALSAKSLVNVSTRFAGKISKLTVGLFYTLATVVNLAYHGKLLQTLQYGVQAFRENPWKAVIPTTRNAIAVVFGVVIILNGYGNGATAGGGAIAAEHLPSWLVGLISPQTLTVILASVSSMALNKGAIDEIYQTDTPILRLENPGAARNPEHTFTAFFDTKVRPGTVVKKLLRDKVSSDESSVSSTDVESCDSGEDQLLLSFPILAKQ